jgi:hypothetical protein
MLKSHQRRALVGAAVIVIGATQGHQFFHHDNWCSLDRHAACAPLRLDPADQPENEMVQQISRSQPTTNVSTVALSSRTSVTLAGRAQAAVHTQEAKPKE